MDNGQPGSQHTLRICPLTGDACMDSRPIIDGKAAVIIVASSVLILSIGAVISLLLLVYLASVHPQTANQILVLVVTPLVALAVKYGHSTVKRVKQRKVDLTIEAKPGD